MTTIRRTNGALPVAQVDTLTLGGTWATGDTITCTINGKDIVLTVGTTTTTAQIAADIVDMWNGDAVNGDESRSELGSNITEFTEITASVGSSTTVLFTGDTKGYPFTLTVTRVTASTGTVSLSTTIACAGPDFWTGADNWDNGEPVTAANEVQLVNLSSGSASGGTFTLSYDGQGPTTAIAQNADGPTTVQAALEALSNIGAGNIAVAGTSIGGGYTCTFQGDLRYTNVAQMTVDGGSLTGSSPVAQVTTQTPGYAGDDVIIDIDSTIKYGLAQSSVVLKSLRLEKNFGESDSQIGLYERNQVGTEYNEYRDQYLQISALSLTIDTDADLMRIDTGDVDCNLLVIRTGGGDNDQPALLWKGNNSSNILTLRQRAYMGIAYFGDDTTTLSTIDANQGSRLVIGSGVTIGSAVDFAGQSMELHSTVPTLTLYGGQINVEEGGVTTLYGYGASTITWNSTGTLGTPYLGDTAFLDFSKDQRAKTVANPIELQSPNCVVNDPYKVVTTLIVDANHQGGVAQVNWGQNVRLTRGAVS